MPDGTIITPILFPGNAALRIGSLLEQYQNGKLQQGYVLEIYPVLLPAKLQDVANNLTTAAGALVFAHELGHVAHKVSPARGVDWTAEQHVDTFAFELMAAISPRIGLAWNYAGALLVIRSYASLERAGYSSVQRQSPPAQRVEWLKELIRLGLTYIEPIELAWTEVVFEQLLTAVEAVLLLCATQWDGTEPENTKFEAAPPASTESRARELTQAEIELKSLQRLHPPWEWADLMVAVLTAPHGFTRKWSRLYRWRSASGLLQDGSCSVRLEPTSSPPPCVRLMTAASRSS